MLKTFGACRVIVALLHAGEWTISRKSVVSSHSGTTRVTAPTAQRMLRLVTKGCALLAMRCDRFAIATISTVALVCATVVGSASADASSTVARTSPDRARTASTPTARAAKAKQARITVTGGTELNLTVAPALKGNSSYTFTLEVRKTRKKWKRVGSYKTLGKNEHRSLSVGTGQYRVSVKAVKGVKATSKTFSYTKVPAGTYSRDYDWVYYFPSGYKANGGPYPVIVAFSPGEAESPPGPYDTQLRGVADRYGFIVMSSRYYRNGAGPTDPVPVQRYPDQDQYAMNWQFDLDNPCHQNISTNYETARSQMFNAFDHLPIDRSRVVLMGLSGGASYAHALNIQYPGLAAAMVINTGMIWGTALPTTDPANGPTWHEYMEACRSSADYVDSRRQAWFIESSNGPTGPDFRHDEMLADATRYRTVGWDVHEVDFYGGHTMAPVAVYDSIFAQLTSSPSWR